MPYTAAQLVTAYTAATDGIIPDTATVNTLTSYANQNVAGTLTDAQALGKVVDLADPTTAVAVQAYQFFTGKSPSKAGLDFLVNSVGNATDLNDPYYAQFNIENRYINFAANLGLLGDGAAAFAATYGAMNFTAFVAATYEQIIGSSYATAAGINVANALADIVSRQAAFTQTARDRQLINANSTPAQVDLATKAAVIGYLLVEGIKADVGLYAAGSNNFIISLINGNPQYNVNILTTYSPLGGGLGTPVPAVTTSGVMLVTTDNYLGSANNDVITGVIYSDSVATTTFNVADNVNGAGGSDTLNLTVSKAAGSGTTGSIAVPAANLNSVETINVRSLSSTATDVTSVNATSFNGTTAINSDRSTNTVTITNLAAGASAGLIGDATTNSANLNFGYATANSAAVLNINSGTRGTANITITSAPTTVTINTAGSFNSVGAIALGGAATAVTINAGTAFNTSGITGFGSNATLTVSGAAVGAVGSPTVIAGAGVLLGTLHANVATLNASGMTAGGVQATIGANAALNFTGGADFDIITVAAGTGAALTGAINAGGGTTDRVIFSTGADLTAGSGAKFTNFEILGVTNGGGPGSLQSYNPDFITGLTGVTVMASPGSVQVTELNGGENVTVAGSVNGGNSAGALSLLLNNAGGGADSVSVTLDNTAVLTGTVSNTGIQIGGLALGGSTATGQVETLNLVSKGTIATGNPINQVILADSSVGGTDPATPSTIAVSGSQGLLLITGALSHALTVNASTMDATGWMQFNSAAGGAFAVNVTGSGQNDNIVVGGSQTGTLKGGGGGDIIVLAAGQQTLSFASGESKLDLAGVSGSSGSVPNSTGGMDRILNFQSGTDKITVTDVAGLAGTVIADKGAAADATAVNNLIGLANFYQDGGNVLRKVAQLDWNAGTLVFVDSNASGAYDAGDLVFFLAGVTANIVGADFI